MKSLLFLSLVASSLLPLHTPASGLISQNSAGGCEGEEGDESSCSMQKVLPLTSWSLSSEMTRSGHPLPQVKMQPNGEYMVPVPSTVFGGLLQGGYVEVDPMYGKNLNYFTNANYSDQNWRYACRFPTPPSSTGQKFVLEFQGISYKANLTVNGHMIANTSTFIGTFRHFRFDVTDYLHTSSVVNENEIVIDLVAPNDHTFPPTGNTTDLALVFVDWNPPPPDRSMGLFRPVNLIMGGMMLSDTTTTASRGGGGQQQSTTTTINNDAIVSSIQFTADGMNPQKEVDLTVRLELDSITGKGDTGCGEIKVSFELSYDQPEPHTKAFNLVDSYRNIGGGTKWYEWTLPNVSMSNGRHLWNPWQMGEPTLHHYRVTRTCGTNSLMLSNGTFGIRTVSKRLSQSTGSAQFSVNGQDILIRGGGWAPDMFLRKDHTKLRRQLEMVKEMNLNAIRLEGKMESNEFFQLTDELGLLVLPGWCCCDAWQHWFAWGSEQFLVANESMKTQSRRLAIRPSVIVFLYSSDELPPENVEKMYLSALNATKWPNPTLNSAAAVVSNITGSSGVKMSGPYAWVPPVYWLLDNNETYQNYGGAWGFLTEGGPGAAPLTLTSWRRTTPAEPATARWNPVDGPLSSWWTFHCGNPIGLFWNIRYFIPPLMNRYLGLSGGESELKEEQYGRAAVISQKTSTSASASTTPWSGDEEFTTQSQLASYEDIRSMFEGYSKNKVNGHATGVIQWMMNNAWPSNIWHLYDYYLNQGGGYYGAKKACEGPIHLMMSYVDGNVYAINNFYTDIDSSSKKLTMFVEIYDTRGLKVYTSNTSTFGPEGTTTLKSNDVARLHELQIPSWKMLKERAGLTTDVYLVNLRIQNTTASSSRDNWYWLSKTMDIVNWTDSNFYRTGVSQYADFSGLKNLPTMTRGIDYHVGISETSTSINSQGLNVTKMTIETYLTDPSKEGVLFFVELTIAARAKSSSKNKEEEDWSTTLPVDGISLSDNYFTLVAPSVASATMTSYSSEIPTETFAQYDWKVNSLSYNEVFGGRGRHQEKEQGKGNY